MPADTAVKTANEKAQRKVEKLLEKRDAAWGQVEAILAKAVKEDRELTETEVSERAAAQADAERCDAALEERAAKADRTTKGADFRNRLGIGGGEGLNFDGTIKVGGEAHTYERGNGNSYFMDLWKMGAGAGVQGFQPAMERLRKHAGEIAVDAIAADKHGRNMTPQQRYFVSQVVEAINPREDGSSRSDGRFNRDLSTANGSGGEFVPPAYLTEQYIPLARPARVLADAQTKQELPPGTMSINIPKVTGGTTVDTQGTQNTNVSDTDMTTTFVTFPVVTVAGAQVLSLQLLERSPVAFDDIVMKDLALAQAAKVDYKVGFGPGLGDVTGIYNTGGINTITWTQASPTIKGFYGQAANAKAQIAQARFLPATHIFMTPNRWEWIEQQVDSNNRPLVLPEQNGPWNVMQVSPDAAVAEGNTGGRMLSCAVLQDFNIPANISGDQDLVLVLKADDNYLYESPLVTRALPQTYGAQLSVLLQLYGYIAFTAARYPVSNSVITGTGLVTPTFNS